jgi:hypothetical protein
MLLEAKRCVVCGEANPILLEKHHLYGRKISDELAWLCKNCHYSVSYHQNRLPRSVRDTPNSESERLAFILVTNGALLERQGAYIRQIGEKIANGEKLWK